MTTKLNRFIQRARANQNHVHTSLMGLLFEQEGLHESFDSLDGRKALEIDKISKEDYKQNLSNNIADLAARLRRLGYVPKPVRRVYIPKINGGKRPLGVPCLEDKNVQDRIARILMGIWEPQFRECSYGYRPKRSAHDALKRLDEVIFKERTQYVVEADIKGFFNTISHRHLERFLRHRIKDPKFLRIIIRFLKSGVMEDGRFYGSEAGTPQGGLVSPVLSNIYLHYVLDLWFEKKFTRQCSGKAYLIRYCDDFVACFQNKQDAELFYAELGRRLENFDLELEPSKTKILAFGSRQFGVKGRATFTFLGFVHYVGKTRRGYFTVGRRTELKRVRLKLKMVKERLKRLRTVGGDAMVKYLRRHLHGHIRYYGVSGNIPRVSRYCSACQW